MLALAVPLRIVTFCNVFFVSVFVDVFELSVEGFAALLSAVADGVVVDVLLEVVPVGVEVEVEAFALLLPSACSYVNFILLAGGFTIVLIRSARTRQVR